MIQGVIFDIGGVLAYDVWEHLLLDPPGTPTSVSARFQIPIPEVSLRVLGVWVTIPATGSGRWSLTTHSIWAWPIR